MGGWVEVCVFNLLDKRLLRRLLVFLSAHAVALKTA